MLRGTIKMVVLNRGFGFIVPEEGGKDIFFHFTALKNVKMEELVEGDEVYYEVESRPKGQQAVVVEKLKAFKE